MTDHTNTTYPNADQELEAIEKDKERIEKEEERLRRGEPALPWPYSSKGLAAIGIALVAGGSWAMGIGTNDAMILIGAVSAGAGIVLLILSRWIHDHFEIGEQPRYTEPTATDGGEAES